MIIIGLFKKKDKSKKNALPPLPDKLPPMAALGAIPPQMPVQPMAAEYPTMQHPLDAHLQDNIAPSQPVGGTHDKIPNDIQLNTSSPRSGMQFSLQHPELPDDEVLDDETDFSPDSLPDMDDTIGEPEEPNPDLVNKRLQVFQTKMPDQVETAPPGKIEKGISRKSEIELPMRSDIPKKIESKELPELPDIPDVKESTPYSEIPAMPDEELEDDHLAELGTGPDSIPAPSTDEAVPKPPAIFSDESFYDTPNEVRHLMESDRNTSYFEEPVERKEDVMNAPSLKGPIFVEIDSFKTILGDISNIKNTIKSSDIILSHINEIKESKDRELDKWHSLLEDMQRKLNYVDKIVYKEA